MSEILQDEEIREETKQVTAIFTSGKKPSVEKEGRTEIACRLEDGERAPPDLDRTRPPGGSREPVLPGQLHPRPTALHHRDTPSLQEAAGNQANLPPELTWPKGGGREARLAS